MTRPSTRAIAAPALCVLALGACTTHGTAARGMTRPTGDRAVNATTTLAAAVGQPAATPRQVVRTGDMRVEVDEVRPAQLRLERALAALGGQVSRVEADAKDRADYLLRVPPERLDALMDSAAALGTVKTRTATADDVTERVVDAEARLTALKASRDRLRQLLDRANGVTDVVTVERELARVQSEVESLEARLAALKGFVAMSQLSVRLDRRIELGPVAALFVGVGRLLGKLFVRG